MTTHVVISAMSNRRIARARVEAGAPGDEVLIVWASLDAANDLERAAVLGRGAAFGWQ